MISVDGISKTYKDPKKGPIHAVIDVSWRAEAGTVFGLLGANGAGKTTLMRILATLINADSGRATVGGFDVATQSTEVRRSLGFLSGTTSLYGRLTIKESLAYFGGLYGLSSAQIKERSHELIERFDIGSYSDKLGDRLSTGQKQRASIARAVFHDPPVILFDEPTSGLDVISAQTVLEFIEEERARGKTIVYSTHIMSEAERLCDWAALIHEGRLIHDGSIASLLAETEEERLEKAFLKKVGYARAGAAV
jgi:sodium transport system ATP-binding protein